MRIRPVIFPHVPANTARLPPPATKLLNSSSDAFFHSTLARESQNLPCSAYHARCTRCVALTRAAISRIFRVSSKSTRCDITPGRGALCRCTPCTSYPLPKSCATTRLPKNPPDPVTNTRFTWKFPQAHPSNTPRPHRTSPGQPYAPAAEPPMHIRAPEFRSSSKP